MKGLNPELTAKIAAEVAIKKLTDAARDLVERRRPTTRASIESILDRQRLNDDLYGLECTS